MNNSCCRKLFKLPFLVIFMLKRKKIRQKGKVSFTKYFQKFNSGDPVAVVRELAVQSPGFPSRIQGRTGKVVSKRGSAYVVNIYDYDKEKQYIIKPVHLKKIENMEAKKIKL